MLKQTEYLVPLRLKDLSIFLTYKFKVQILTVRKHRFFVLKIFRLGKEYSRKQNIPKHEASLTSLLRAVCSLFPSAAEIRY
jgi:hypothetical protein